MAPFPLLNAALRFGDEEYDVTDLVLVALAEGQWQRFEARLARGMLLERDRGGLIEAGRVAEAAKRFRYARGLISGKDLRTWLADRSLVLEDLRRHCLRTLLLEEHGGGGERVSPGELADVLGSEAFISGALGAAAARLGDLVAMAAGAETDPPPAAEVSGLAHAARQCAAGLGELGAGELERRCARILGLLRAEGAFVGRAATSEGLARCFAEHRVDWLRVECSELTFVSEGAAREALLCLRVDGTPLAHLSRLLGIATHPREHYLGDLAGGSAPVLASAPIGDAVGPFEAGDGWSVLMVNGRVAPSEHDPELVRRATAGVVEGACERVKAGKLRELAPF